MVGVLGWWWYRCRGGWAGQQRESQRIQRYSEGELTLTWLARESTPTSQGDIGGLSTFKTETYALPQTLRRHASCQRLDLFSLLSLISGLVSLRCNTLVSYNPPNFWPLLQPQRKTNVLLWLFSYLFGILTLVSSKHQMKQNSKLIINFNLICKPHSICHVT